MDQSLNQPIISLLHKLERLLQLFSCHNCFGRICCPVLRQVDLSAPCFFNFMVFRHCFICLHDFENIVRISRCWGWVGVVVDSVTLNITVSNRDYYFLRLVVQGIITSELICLSPCQRDMHEREATAFISECLVMVKYMFSL